MRSSQIGPASFRRALRRDTPRSPVSNGGGGVSSTVVSGDDQGGSAPKRYLRYAGYLWLLQAGLWGLMVAFLTAARMFEVAIAFGLAVGVPVLIYYGLRHESRAAWYVHMGLSVLSLTSIIGIVGLYLGWKGREAVGVEWSTDGSSFSDDQPSPSAPTASRSPAPESSTDDATTTRVTDDTSEWGTDGDSADDEDDGIEYWGVDDRPTATGDWGDEN